MASTHEIDKRYTYNPPFGNQPARYEEIRAKAREFAHLLNGHCPESREKSLALTHLDEVVMWANAAIARNEVNPKDFAAPVEPADRPRAYEPGDKSTV